jgi:hypothetical protein
VFYALRHGDFGPLIFGCLALVVGIVFVLNLRGAALRMTERVVEKLPIYRGLGGVPFGFWTLRLAGLVGVVMGIALILVA